MALPRYHRDFLIKISLTNVPLWVFSILFLVPIVVAFATQKMLSIGRPLIAIESTCLALILVLIYGRRILFLTIYFFIFVPIVSVQVVEIVSLRFGIKVFDCYHILISGVEGLPNIAKYGLCAFFFFFFIVFLLLIYCPFSEKSTKFWKLILLVGSLVVYDVALSANKIFPKDVVRYPNILGAPILNMKFLGAQNKISFWDPPPRSFIELGKAVSTENSVLSVSFESLGVPIENASKIRIDELIINSFPGYKLTDSFVEPFNGGTLSGELRMLCGIKDFGSLLVNTTADTGNLVSCLPSVAKNINGFSDAVSAHANYGGIYNRTQIYPLLGFNKAIFASDLQDEMIEACGSMQFAACDTQIVRQLSAHLNSIKEGKVFVHLMTIDSHFPYASKISRKSTTINLFEMYMSSISMTALALGEFVGQLRSPPSYILISGDHSPPFIDESARNMFNSKVVPVYILKLASQ